MNLKLKNLEKNIIFEINNSDLPVGVVYYIIKNLLNEIEQLYNINVEQQQKHIHKNTQQYTNSSIVFSQQIKQKQADKADQQES